MTNLPTSVLAAAAVTAVLGAAAIVTWLHAVAPSGDFIRYGVSAYGVGTHAAWYRAQVVATGCGGLLLLVALIRHTPASLSGLALLAAYGVSRVAIARYPTDLEGETATRTGAIHALLAAVSFAALGVAAPLVALSLPSVEVGGHDSALLWLATAVTTTALGTFAAGLLPVVRRAFGLVERAFYAASLGWLAGTGLALAVAHA